MFCLIFVSKRNDDHGNHKNGKQFKGQQHVDKEKKEDVSVLTHPLLFVYWKE